MWYDLDEHRNVVKLPEGQSPGDLGGRSWQERRRVALTEDIEGTGAWVSTVFLGLDHSWATDPPAQPVVFESMAFGAPNDFQETECVRYCTWAEAEAGHEAMVARVRALVLASRPKAPPEPAPLASRARAFRLDADQ